MRAEALNSAQTENSEPVIGFDGDDTFAGSAGDDELRGLGGSDTYMVARGTGHDTIAEGATADLDVDRIEFTDFVSSEVSVSRLHRGSSSIKLEFVTSPGDSVTILNALDGGRAGIEQYVFSDGAIWSASHLEALLANSAPEATDDGYFSAVSGEALTLSAERLLANDFDTDGDPLMIIAVDGGAHGTAELDHNGNIVFTANADHTGPAQLTYTVSDGRNGISTAQVNVRVRPVAEAVADTDFETAEDTPLQIDAVRLLSNDVNGEQLIVAQVHSPENGTVSLNSSGQITFTPDANFNGLAAFTYVVNSPDGGVDEARVEINVTAVNDAPVAVTDTGFVTDEEVPFQILAASLAVNDLDAEDSVLTVTDVQGSAELDVTLTDDGYVIVTPAPSFFGTASFSYTVTDGEGLSAQGTAEVTVNPVNDAPQTSVSTFDTTEDTPLIIQAADILANVHDPDGDTLTIVDVNRFLGNRGQC